MVEQKYQETTITGIFPSSRQARLAVVQLKNAGFTDDQIQMERDPLDAQRQADYRVEERPKTGAGAAIGAVIGALVGALIAAGLLGLLPGIGAVLETDTLLTLILGAGVGALIGLLLGASIGRGRNEEVRTPVERSAADQRTVVTVHTSNWTEQAEEILRRGGAIDLQVTPEPVPAGVADDRQTLLGVDEQQKIESLPLVEERLVADTTERQLGTVRIRTVPEETTGRLEVAAERDEVFVEHVPVGSIVSERREPWDDDGTLVIPVYEEQLVVSKRLILREEIRVRRTPTTDVQIVEDTLRRDRLVIEDPDHTGAIREQYPTDRQPNEMYTDSFETADESARRE